MTIHPNRGRLTPSDIVELAGVAPSTVSNWRKRHEDFPQPVGGASGRPVFDEQEIRSWLNGRGIQIQTSRPAASLVTQLLDGLAEQMSPEAATLLIHQALAIRFLCEQGRADVEAFAQANTSESLGALAWLCAPEGTLTPQELTPKHVAESGVAMTVGTVASLDASDLIETSDTVLRRFTGGRARAGGEHGSLESRTTRILERSLWIQDTHETIYDPACGIGQLLLEVIERYTGVRRVVGAEINPWAATIARVRFLLRGIPAEIRTADSLADDPFPELLADVVLVEPPITGPKDRAFEWLNHAAKHLAPEGLGLVLTRKRALADSTNAEERRELVAAGIVQGVIELPGKLLQHTSSALALWMLRAPNLNPPPVGLLDGSGQSVPEDYVQAWVEDVDLNQPGELSITAPFVQVSVADLLSGTADLTPRHWVSAADRNPAEVIARYEHRKREFDERSTETDAEFSFDGLPRASAVTTLGALETEGVVEIHRGTVPATLNPLPEGVIDGHQLRHMATQLRVSGGSSMRHQVPADGGITQTGDVIVTFSESPEAAVEDHGPHLLTKDLFLIRTNTDTFDPHFLAMCAKAPWNARDQSGESKSQLIKEMEIPLLDLTSQRDWVRQVRELEQHEAQIRAAAEAALQLRHAALNVMGFGKGEA